MVSRGGNNLLTFALNQYEMAIRGDAEAMVALGGVYEAELDIADKAAYWYQKGMHAGSSNGAYFYGECCRRGYGVEQDGVVGSGLILSAAQKGNKFAIDQFKENGMSLDQMRSYGIPV